MFACLHLRLFWDFFGCRGDCQEMLFMDYTVMGRFFKKKILYLKKHHSILLYNIYKCVQFVLTFAHIHIPASSNCTRFPIINIITQLEVAVSIKEVKYIPTICYCSLLATFHSGECVCTPSHMSTVGCNSFTFVANLLK